MTTLSNKIKIGKQGVNYITTIVDNNGCNFQPIAQENDVGIDGIIELFDKGNPKCQFIYAQIKTGDSYFESKNNLCTIPIGEHRAYWKTIPCPVIGIVCRLEDGIVTEAFWVDVKSYLIAYPSAKSIKFPANKEHKFDADAFKLGMPILLYHQFPKLRKEYYLNLLSKRIFEDVCYIALGKYYSQDVDVWEKIFEAYEHNNSQLNISWFYDALTYLYPHPDHWRNCDTYNFSECSKYYIVEKISKFTEEDIIKMLNIIGEDGIERGTIGESIAILIPQISQYQHKLVSIITNASLSEEIKNYANYILAAEDQNFYFKHLQIIMSTKLESSRSIIKHIKQYGSLQLF